ncbi:unnamed protein product [Arabidopsis lyrata]|nr:unnamed protein product [Arabidopsis lyrata]
MKILHVPHQSNNNNKGRNLAGIFLVHIFAKDSDPNNQTIVVFERALTGPLQCGVVLLANFANNESEVA